MEFTYLQHLQFAQSLLYQLLYPPLIVYTLTFPKCVARSPFGILAKIVGGELTALAQKRAVLYKID